MLDAYQTEKSPFYRRRIIDAILDELTPELPAISIEGARGVGKTETAARRAHTVFSLDVPAKAEVIANNPDQLGVAEGPVLVDEWQRVPVVWDWVRRAVDRGAPPGQFLFTGSAPTRESPVHTGAGRIVRLRMRPMSFAERRPEHQSVFLRDLQQGRGEVQGHSPLGLPDYVDEIVRSGFPGVRHLDGRARRARLDSFLDRIIEREFPDAGITVRRPERLREWLRAYAAATGSTASFQTILDAATPGIGDKPSRLTANSYRDALESLWLLDPVSPWAAPGGQFRAIRSQVKHYLADPALTARLLLLDEDSLLAGATVHTLGPQEGTILGRLFEALVAQSLLVYADALESHLSFYRDPNGRREVDFLLEGPGGSLLAFEVKLRATVSSADVKHLLWLKEEMGPRLTDTVVITTGPTAYRREDGVAVVPLGCLGVDRDMALGPSPEN